MKRLLLAVFACAALAMPASASAAVTEIGGGGDAVKSKCPADPCQVLNQVTGYQGRAGSQKNPYVIPRRGYIVAFSVTLADLAQNQVNFFNSSFGSPASVRLSILRKGKKKKSRLDHRLIRQSEVFRVDRYFGSTPSFVLDKPLLVGKGYIVAITVPTWAPAFAYDLPRNNWWRSSRQKGTCDRSPPASAPQQRVNRVVRYGCTFHTARLQYTATYVPDPQPTDGSDRTPRRGN